MNAVEPLLPDELLLDVLLPPPSVEGLVPLDPPELELEVLVEEPHATRLATATIPKMRRERKCIRR